MEDEFWEIVEGDVYLLLGVRTIRNIGGVEVEHGKRIRRMIRGLYDRKTDYLVRYKKLIERG